MTAFLTSLLPFSIMLLDMLYHPSSNILGIDAVSNIGSMNEKVVSVLHLKLSCYRRWKQKIPLNCFLSRRVFADFKISSATPMIHAERAVLGSSFAIVKYFW